MPPSPHATERVEESQTREIVKHSKCSKRKKQMVHDLKMDSILLQKMQEKDNFIVLTNKEILQGRNDHEREKFVKEKNLPVVKEKNLIVEKREDGKIYAHQITIHIYGITKTKFPEIIKRPRRKSKKKNSRRCREKRCSLNMKRMSKRKRIASMVRRGEKQNLNVLTKKRSIKAKEDRIGKRPAFKVQHAGPISYLLSLLRKFLSSGIIPQGLTFLYFCVNGVEGSRPTNESYEDYIMYFVRSFFNLLQYLGSSQNFEWRVPIAIGSGAFIWNATRPSSDQSRDPTRTLLGLGVVLRGPQVDRIIRGPRLVPSQPTTTPSTRGTRGAEVQRPMTTKRLDVVQRQPEQIYTDHLARQEGTTPSASGLDVVQRQPVQIYTDHLARQEGTTPSASASDVSSTARVPRSSGCGADPPEVFPLASRDIPDTDRVVDIWDKDQHVHRLRVSARETFDIYEKIGPILRGLGWINYILVDDQDDPVDTITPGTSRINLHLVRIGNVTSY